MTRLRRFLMIHVRELSAGARYLMTMSTMVNRRGVLLLGLALAGAAGGLARADDRDGRKDGNDRDHERARRALDDPPVVMTEEGYAEAPDADLTGAAG